jgi:hypothetical protein
MSPTAPALSVNPVVRFRTRTLLGVITGAAIVLAVTGAYYRRQTAEVQTALLIYWAVVATFFVIGAWHNWRVSWRIPTAAGAPHFMIFTPKPGVRRSPAWRPLRWIAPCTWLVLVAIHTDQVVDHVGRPRALFLSVGIGLSDGMILALAAYALFTSPTYICEHAVSTGMALAPWKYVRHASWLPDRLTWLKLRRLDGDLYLEIPEKDRAAIEAFVRSKTQFKEPDPAPAVSDVQMANLAPGQ